MTDKTEPNGREVVVTAFDVTIEDDSLSLLRDMVDPDSKTDADDLTPVRLLCGAGHSGYGLYVASSEYPEEGAILLAPIKELTALESAQKAVAAERPKLDTLVDMAIGAEKDYIAELEAALRQALSALDAGYTPAIKDAISKCKKVLK